jgi:tetratricopeptide (TPR) repeat protein
MIRIVVVMMVALVGVAIADDGKPWAVGVSDVEQKTALGIYREGNTEFTESRYVQALAKYREALKHWDHPGIRFNMAVCLINLDQAVEAFEHLEVALKYGAAPLGEEAHAQGLTYKKLLLGQLARLRIKSAIDGAEVTLDGKPLFTGRSDTAKLLTPGPHQIVATKPGFAPSTTSLVLMPGKETVHDIVLHPLRTSSAKTVRRWKTSRPWFVVGGGAVLAGAGILVQRAAVGQRDDYNTALANCNPDPTIPCPPNFAKGDKDLAILENRIAIGMFTVGGAAIVTGAVLVYLNRARIVYERPVPMVTVRPDGATLDVTARF